MISKTFRSFSTKNYRLYFFGQMVSQTGTWMQAVAQDWLVLKITDRALPVGLTTALQFLPVLLFGLWSGAVADRLDKRKILYVTQGAMGFLALSLALLTSFGLVRLWMVYVLAFLLGCATAFDSPARQAFISELVPAEKLPNAVALNSAAFNVARILGPSLAGIVVGAWDIAPAFYLNAVSFGAVLLALSLMDPGEILRTEPSAGHQGGIGEGLRHVWSSPKLRNPLLLMALVATLGINFRVVLPILARFAFNGGPEVYGLLASLFASGSLIGALGAANVTKPSYRVMVLAAGAFGLLAFSAALAPTLFWEGVCLVPLGAAAITFLSTANSLLQTNCEPAMRGRVMSLYAVIFLGSTPIGGALVGWLSEVTGPRAGLYLAAASGLCGAAFSLRSILGKGGHSGDVHLRG